MANSRYYSSTAAVTNLQATAGPGDATIQVASSAGFPNSFPYTLSLDYGSANEELVDVTGGGPSVFNVTRAVDGTSATTHNAGAVVRHVSSARDFTDSRTHEAATSGVHGTTGSIVDTLSTQTLQNKTLSAPTINNGTVTGSVTATGATVTNGTFSGATVSGGHVTGSTNMAGAALTGAWSNAGDITNTGQLLQQNLTKGQRAATSDSIYETRVAGDAKARWSMTADGGQSWGDGTNNADLFLARISANTAQLTGNLTVTGNQNVNGSITTPGALSAGNLVLTNQTITTFVPVWHGHDASMLVNVGYYTKYGKWVDYVIYTVFSSSSSLTGSVSVEVPTAPYRGPGGGTNYRQQLGTVWYTDVAGGGSFPDTNCMGHHCTFAGDTGTNTQPLKNYRDNTFTGGLIVGPSPNTIITINGRYREA